jgi:hypothetical protein
MPSLQVLIETGAVCRCLRAKTLAYSPVVVGDPVAASFYENAGLEGPCWCAQTQGIQGPDGKIASAENCHSECGRECCEVA